MPYREPPAPNLPKFREDSLAITEDHVQFIQYGRAKEMATDDIESIAFGGEIRETSIERYELLRRVRYTFKYAFYVVRLQDSAGTLITVEICAREKHEHEAFERILEKLSRFVIPKLIRRIATILMNNGAVQIGKLKLAKRGVRAKTGWIFKTEHFVPYEELSVEYKKDRVTYRALKNPKVKGRLDPMYSANVVILEQVVDCMAKLNQGRVTLDDLVQPSVFQARVEPKTESLDEHGSINLFQIAVQGPILAPSDDYPAFYEVQILDVTEGAEEPKPVVCTIEQFQAADTVIFEYESDDFPIPYTHSVLSQWVTVVSVPVNSLVFARKGRRALQFVVTVLSAESEQALAVARTTVTHDNERHGYEEITENRKRADELAVKLAISISAADGRLDKVEGTVVTEWARKRVNTARESDRAEVKARLNRAAKETVSAVRSGGVVAIERICEELNDITDLGDRYDILELCMRVAGADQAAAEEELAELDSLAEFLELDCDRFRAMMNKMLPIGIHTDKNARRDARRVLGITDDMTLEEIKAHLLKEFQTWNSRVVHSDPKVRERAARMLELIAAERTRVDAALAQQAKMSEVRAPDVPELVRKRRRSS